MSQGLDALVLTPSDFVALCNQTLEFSYPTVVLEGELSSFRISKNKWVYADLKDAGASLRLFGTVYMLPGPLEDGMLVQVVASPRLHPQFGFSLQLQRITPVGAGALKRAQQLLQAKLTAEGLFEPARKRRLPAVPLRVGLLTSVGSAAYHDFVKILNERWGGVALTVVDVQVQGELARQQLVAGLEQLNSLVQPLDVIVMTRGGGSADDLSAFNTEQVTRAVAMSRVPTLVAIGHEVDVSLAELAADVRASTPTNAAMIVVPDKVQAQSSLQQEMLQVRQRIDYRLQTLRQLLAGVPELIISRLQARVAQERQLLMSQRRLLQVLSPRAALERGYALIWSEAGLVRSCEDLTTGMNVRLTLKGGSADATIKAINR